MMPYIVLILDGEQRASLAATRSLGRMGLRVIVGSEQAASLAGSSRFAHHTFLYRSPLKTAAGFIEDIQLAVQRERVDLILPITDITMYHCLKHATDLSPAALPYVSFDKYLAASNKIELIRMAMELDVPVPHTVFITGRKDLETVLPNLTYPLVLKPQASLIAQGATILRTTVKIVRNEDELQQVVDTPAFAHAFMIQELLHGEGVGIFTLFHRGQPSAVFSHRRIREKPPWGGVSAVSESTLPDSEAKDYAFRLLKRLDWNGPAMVEFKRDDRRGGIPVLMEINARFWGSLQLSIDAGVDFPVLLYMQATGQSFEPVMHYHYTRLRWLLGDFDSLYVTMKSPLSRLPLEYHNKAKVLWEFIKEFSGPAKLEVLRRDDLRPFLWELRRYFAEIAKK